MELSFTECMLQQIEYVMNTVFPDVLHSVFSSVRKYLMYTVYTVFSNCNGLCVLKYVMNTVFSNASLGHLDSNWRFHREITGQ